MSLIWVAVAVICLILELTAGNLFIICFSIGAASASITAFMGTGIYFQVITFAAVSVASIFFLRPIVLKYFHKNTQERKSNADALIGRQAKVIEPIPADGYGYVQIDGDQWRAVSIGNTKIPLNSKVTVMERNSIILTVTPL